MAPAANASPNGSSELTSVNALNAANAAGGSTAPRARRDESRKRWAPSRRDESRKRWAPSRRDERSCGREPFGDVLDPDREHDGDA
jgi:hypothetical protein